MTSETNTDPVERIYPDDKRVKPQTIAHHMARYNFANKHIKKNADVLDLGCGTGYGSQMMRDMGHTVTGLDISNEAIQYAQEAYPEGRYELVDMTQWNPTASYDAVTFFEVIEHLQFEEGVKILQQVYNALKPGGVFILSTPRDINEQRNGWHQSKWDNMIIHEELSKLFPQVSLYGQDWDTAEIRTENVANEDFYIALAKKAY